jgi:hypothetical protein
VAALSLAGGDIVNQDKQQYEQYLKILSVFHYVVGGIAALFACFPIIHFVVGLLMLVSSFVPGPVESTEGSSAFPFFPMTFMGLFFTVLAGSMILLGWAFAVCMVIAGRSLATRTRYMFCMVMAGIACTSMPFGTVLGVFTILVLMQPVVKEMFQVKQMAAT